MRALIMAAAIGLASPALAQTPPPPPDPACQGDPACYVVPGDHPDLDGANGIYYPDRGPDGTIFLNGHKLRTHPECGKLLYDHENYHRQQHKRGELKGNPWAETYAQQEAPIYNCGDGSPRGSVGRYTPPAPPWGR